MEVQQRWEAKGLFSKKELVGGVQWRRGYKYKHKHQYKKETQTQIQDTNLFNLPARSFPNRKLRSPEEEARISSWSSAEYAPKPPVWNNIGIFNKDIKVKSEFSEWHDGPRQSRQQSHPYVEMISV